MDTDSRQAGIEITEEMVKYGTRAYRDFQDFDGAIWEASVPAMIAAILRAGLEARHEPAREGAKAHC